MLKKFKKTKNRNKIIAVSICLLVVLMGTFLQLQSRAAVSFGSVEGEQSSLTSQVKKVADINASAGSAIQFGSGNQTFVHPGILVNKSQLDFVKGKLATSQQPWTGGKTRIYSRFQNTAYVASPVSQLNCSTNAAGCSALVEDSIAAYTQALFYYYSSAPDRAKHAQAAIKIMNAWSGQLTSYSGNQAKLTLGWSGSVMPRAAEILRYTYTPVGSEVAFNIPAYTTMLNNVYLPAFSPTDVASTASNGNWQLAMTEAMINIGIFTDNRTVFNNALNLWRARVPAYIYMSSDGATPVRPPGGLYDDTAKLKCFWYGAGTPTTSCNIPSNFAYVQGMAQETCRDISHTADGLASIIAIAETAKIQGVDLYSEQQQRIVAGLEYNAAFTETYLSTGTWPNSPCGGKPVNGDGLGGTAYTMTWEIGYNHYKNRKNVSMPSTLKMIQRVRPTGGANHHAWETLTHADTFNASLQ